MGSRTKQIHNFVPQQNTSCIPKITPHLVQNAVILKQLHFMYMVLTVVLSCFKHNKGYIPETNQTNITAEIHHSLSIVLIHRTLLFTACLRQLPLDVTADASFCAINCRSHWLSKWDSL